MLTSEELDYTFKKANFELSVKNAHEKGVWKFILKQQNFWAIAIARFLKKTDMAVLFLLDTDVSCHGKKMNLKDIAIFGWIPFLAADLGSFVGGMLSPFYQKFGAKVLTARKLAVTTAALLMPFALLIASTPSGVWAVFWFCFGTSATTVRRIPLDVPGGFVPFPQCRYRQRLFRIFRLFQRYVVYSDSRMGGNEYRLQTYLCGNRFPHIYAAFFIWTMMKDPYYATNKQNISATTPSRNYL